MLKHTFQWLLVCAQCCAAISANFRTFSSLQRDRPCLLKRSCLILPPQPPATVHLLSVSMDMPIPDVSYKGNHAGNSLVA